VQEQVTIAALDCQQDDLANVSNVKAGTG